MLFGIGEKMPVSVHGKLNRGMTEPAGYLDHGYTEQEKIRGEAMTELVEGKGVAWLHCRRSQIPNEARREVDLTL